VLHVLPTRDASYGGPVAVVNEYARELVKQGVDADIFPDEGTRTWRRFFYFPGATSLKRLIDSVGAYDLIHIHGVWYAASAVAARVARAKGIPYLITPHGMLDRWALGRGWLKKRVYYLLVERSNLQRAASVHVFNAGEYEASRKALGAVHTFILPNGVDVSAYQDLPDKTVFESTFPQVKGKILLLFLGRINYKKGLDILIPAFQRARRQNSDLHLIIAGPDDGYLRRLKGLIEEHALDDQVTLTGMVSGDLKRQILSAAHIFVLPSYQEGDSMALKEAMAAGLPAIISSACHFPEAEEHDCGVIVPHGAGAVAEAILRLVGDRQRIKAMGERAKRLMRTRYNWAVITGKLIAHYRTLPYQARIYISKSIGTDQ
jgi:glycosyltransferase involved in cell wall biosynthesis